MDILSRILHLPGATPEIIGSFQALKIFDS